MINDSLTMYLLTTQSISQCPKLVMDTETILIQIRNLEFHRREMCIEYSPSASPGSCSTICHTARSFRRLILRQCRWDPLSSFPLLESVSCKLWKISAGSKRGQCISSHRSSLTGAVRQRSRSLSKTFFIHVPSSDLVTGSLHLRLVSLPTVDVAKVFHYSLLLSLNPTLQLKSLY